MVQWKFSSPYYIGQEGFVASLHRAFCEFVLEEGTPPSVVCVFRTDIPKAVVLQEYVLWRSAVISVAGRPVTILSGGWWQTFTPGNIAFLLP